MSEEQTPKEETKSKRPPLKALALCALLVVLGGGIFYWAGASKTAPEPVATQQEKEEIPEPEEPAPSESTPERTPLIAFPEPDDAVPYQEARPLEPPTPSAMPWSEFISRPSMWPRRLSITIDQEIPVRYRDNNYGEMIFSPGQTIEVFELNRDGRVLGSINENTVYIPVTATDLEAWFDGKDDEYDVLAIPDAPEPVKRATNLSKEKESELISRLRTWTLNHYDSHELKIGEDSLILRWTPQEQAEINFRVEAREIARKYLMLCSELGREDNYASCKIYSRSRGDFLGSNGIFIPSL